MAENSKIQWTHHTFNPWIGCAKVHTGCASCYAEALMADRYHRVVWGKEGTRSKTKTWGDPLKWDRMAAKLGIRYRVFCASLADVFEDRADLREWRADLFRLIDRTPNLDWLLLTKRPENIENMWHSRAFFSDDGKQWGQCVPTHKRFKRDNVWLGTSVSNQETYDEFWPRLARCRDLAPVLFLSGEPLVGPILANFGVQEELPDWFIIGGESKQGKAPARACHFDWINGLIAECTMFGVPAFLKQLGSLPVAANGVVAHFKDAHAGDMDEWPAVMRVREFPRAMAVV